MARQLRSWVSTRRHSSLKGSNRQVAIGAVQQQQTAGFELGVDLLKAAKSHLATSAKSSDLVRDPGVGVLPLVDAPAVPAPGFEVSSTSVTPQSSVCSDGCWRARRDRI
jgi:hypothetical protein